MSQIDFESLPRLLRGAENGEHATIPSPAVLSKPRRATQNQANQELINDR